MIIFYSVLFGFLLLYILFIIILTKSLRRIDPIVIENHKEQTEISVIVPIRNEAENLTTLINDLKSQNYPTDKARFILVDDHSTDESNKIIRQLTKNSTQFEVYSLDRNNKGKKHALNLGISNSHSELIAFTDADCRLTPLWLSSFNNFYLTEKKPDLIIGLVDMLPAKSMAEKIFRMEFLSLVLTSSGATLLNKPLFCNGANLCFKKNLYQNIENLHPDVSSGDDVFLLHYAKENKLKIQLLNHPDNRVTTHPPKNILQFLKQRIRWASKSTKYKDIDTIAVSILIGLLSFTFFAGYILSVISKDYLTMIIAILTKSIVDFVLFKSTQNWFKTKKQLWLIPIIEFLYPIYIVATIIMAIIKPFGWKGRKIS